MEDKSEAQLKNEKEVRRIMAERGYSSAPKSSTKLEKKHSKSIIILLSLCAIVAALTITAFIFINQPSTNNSTIAADSNTPIVDTNAESSAKAKDEEKEKAASERRQTQTQKQQTKQQNSPSMTETKNNNSSSSSQKDVDEDRHAVNLHQCDALQAKYDKAKEESNRLYAIYENAYKSQHSYSELYEQAGHNQTVAKQMMQAEQEAVQKAFSDYQNAQKAANNIYWNELTPCKRNMYNIDK